MLTIYWYEVSIGTNKFKKSTSKTIIYFNEGSFKSIC